MMNFEKVSGIKLPPSAKAVAYREKTGALDETLWMVVKLPAADFSVLLSDPLLAGHIWIPATPAVLGHFTDFWSSSPATSMSAVLMLPKAKVLHVLVDQTNPATYMVYFMFST